MECTRLFVYGSLLEGFFNYEKTLVGQVISCVPAKVRGKLFHQCKKGYPALIPGEDWVFGELLELSHIEKTLPLIDEVEEYFGKDKENEYDRILTNVFALTDNTWIEAHLYWYGLQDLGTKQNPVVYLPTGDWRSYMKVHEKTGTYTHS
ncbi:gamma-glutamylcyclotransferase family protein [uncultured Sphaerochaeta sp.]|uniref:gamma-glutamylcyclotransferase family protein n=1 Tax=uncultured Sphaerochaeta sp. TaxID=886478 RepID=UPI002A0A8D91|nr:gamma-glutamylcyclotransferase family protein [uncultured Sphaerochaeta sp.]